MECQLIKYHINSKMHYLHNKTYVWFVGNIHYHSQSTTLLLIPMLKKRHGTMQKIIDDHLCFFNTESVKIY